MRMHALWNALVAWRVVANFLSPTVVECSCISCGGSGSSVHPEPVLKKSKKTLSPETKENQPRANQRSSGKKSSLEDCGFSVESDPKLELVR